MDNNWSVGSLAFAVIIVLVFIAGCGSKSSSVTVSSSTNPSIVYAHSAVTLNGSVYTWGYNGYGQLGNGSTINFVFPTAISNLTMMSGSSVGGSHTIAVSKSGLVWDCGNNGYGQLGDGLLTTSSYPVQVSNAVVPLNNIAAVAAGGNHSLALDNNGELWTWGANIAGQLGNAAITAYYSLYAIQVVDAGNNPLTGIQAIAAGGSHNLALDKNGTVWAWGYNNLGQLGNNDPTGTNSSIPVQVKKGDGTPLSNIGWIAGGGSHSLAVDNNGTVWAWGSNSTGQLGKGNDASGNPIYINSFYAQPVPNLIANTNVKNPISAGLDHSVAIDSTGAVVAWGLNNYYQLGNGNQTSSGQYVSVLKYGLNPLSGIDQVIAVGHYTIAFDANMKGWSWGYNIYGQLGNGSVVNGTLAASVAAPFQ